MTQIFIANQEENYLKGVANYWLEAALTTVESDGKFVVALSGGNTPQKLFSYVTKDYYRSRFPWAKMYFFWVDERCVPPQHPDSNYGMTKEYLLSKVPVPESHVFRMPGETMPPQTGAKAYENAMKAFFKLDKSFPHLDLILLGMGEDGHTASLFPGTDALQNSERWIVSNYVAAKSTTRLTMTFPIINDAKRVAFLCTGASKAGIVRDVFRDDISPTRYPAQRVKPANGELLWFLDSEAASKLKGKVLDEAKHI